MSLNVKMKIFIGKTNSRGTDAPRKWRDGCTCVSYLMERDHCRKASFLLNLYRNMTGDNILLSSIFNYLSRAEYEPNYITTYISTAGARREIVAKDFLTILPMFEFSLLNKFQKPFDSQINYNRTRC